MNEKRQYEIDLDKIKVTLNIDKNGDLKHKPGNQFKLLPYTTNEKDIASDFNGVLGSFSRVISSKELKNEFNPKVFIEDILDQIGEYEGIESKEVLADIIRAIFIDKESLVNFDIKTMNYIASTKSDEKIAKFLYSIFFNEELRSLALQQYDTNVKNLLYKLALDALPGLKENQYSIDIYKCYLPFIKKLFVKDYKFLIKNEELYKQSLRRFLEYYYMFYISQLVIKLNKFEKVDLDKPEILYFTLDWESTSKNRTAYKFGWELIKRNIDTLFSHAFLLDILNHHGLYEQLGYKELFDLFNSTDEADILNRIEDIYQIYTMNIRNIDWENFKQSEKNSDNIAFDKVYKLFEAIEYQFDRGGRLAAKKRYGNWYRKFAEDRFAKRRGPLGYNLNLNEEDIILMTKICIKNNDKLKLSILFDEFEKRGMLFDRDSKIKIIELYEKLNLLEKKSDSGDAQYVKSIL